MGYGIGGGGFLGVALEQLTPPVQAAATTSASGGTLAAGIWRYLVTATNAAGETTVSNEQSVTSTGSTSSNTVNWAAVNGATGYNIYRTAVNGAAGTELQLVTGLAAGAVSYLDTGSLSPAGAQPTANTAVANNIYTAPVKFFPILSETLKFVQATQWRRPIRQSVDNIGGVPGDVHVEGDIVIEGLTDAMVYMHRASRTTLVKTGPISGKYTYTFTPSAAAVAGRTMSVTVVRNGIVFAYTGVVVGTAKYTIANGELQATYTCMGSDETVQALPTPNWTTNQAQPFGAGEYDIEIPTGTQIFDTDTFEFSTTDNATPNYRLRNTGRGAQFIQYKERTTTFTANRDFQSRADYDAFKALTAQAIRMKAVKAVTGEIVQLDVLAGIKDTYEPANLSNQGDLLRSKIVYQNTQDPATGNAYTIQIVTAENMTP